MSWLTSQAGEPLFVCLSLVSVRETNSRLAGACVQAKLPSFALFVCELRECNPINSAHS